MDFKCIPKIELHCHLDGSLSYNLTDKLLKEKGINLSLDEIRKKMQAPMDCSSLAEYLEKFDLPISLLQTSTGLENAAYDLARQAASENVKYIETRFAPVFSKGEGLKVPEIIESVYKGLERAKDEFGIESGIIVCAMRHLDMQTNLDMLHEAMELFGCGLVGCDIAGDEKPHTNIEYNEFFNEAKRLGIPFTIHSGECGNANNIAEAVELGAKRIGHGIAMHNRPDIIKMCSDKRIGVEMCPMSNLQTKAVRNFSNYPFGLFYDAGVPVCINTDNRTVSGTSCTNEWEKLSSIYEFDEDDVKRVYTESVEMSFADDDCKDRLLKKFLVID